MARTKGAKDQRPRNRPHKPQVKPAAKVTPLDRSTIASTPERPAVPLADFEHEIAAQLANDACQRPESARGIEPSEKPPAPAASFEPGALTVEGLAAAWQLPFYLLAKALERMKIAPDPAPIVDVGKRRALELAKPSYAIYEQLAREYLGWRPEDALHVAIGVTVLNAIGILPEILEAIAESKRRTAGRAATAAAAPVPPAGGPPAAGLGAAQG